jgi:hypothetical protein
LFQKLDNRLGLNKRLDLETSLSDLYAVQSDRISTRWVLWGAITEMFADVIDYLGDWVWNCPIV